MQTSILCSLLSGNQSFFWATYIVEPSQRRGGKVERLPSSNCKELNDEMEKENDDILLQSFI
jgi:hypothetical protein